MSLTQRRSFRSVVLRRWVCGRCTGTAYA